MKKAALREIWVIILTFLLLSLLMIFWEVTTWRLSAFSKRSQKWLRKRQSWMSSSLCIRKPKLKYWSLQDFGDMNMLISLFLLRQFSKMPYAAKAKAQQFARRKPNLIKKADQLARLCHADAALIIGRNGRYYTYRSTDHEHWPPTISEIVSNTTVWRL